MLDDDTETSQAIYEVKEMENNIGWKRNLCVLCNCKWTLKVRECEIAQKWNNRKVEGTTVYPSTDADDRNDDSFRGFQQPEHHHGPSAFLRVVPFLNMVAIFVLDFMYLCCHIKCQIPIEFQRKTRPIQYYLKWKATELRFFYSIVDQ